MNAPVTVASGTFQQIDAVRWGQGTVNIYQDASNALTMRFEGPQHAQRTRPARLSLRRRRTQNFAEMTANGVDPVDVGALQSQRRQPELSARQIDHLAQYRSVVIYSPSLDLIYTYAPLFVRQ